MIIKDELPSGLDDVSPLWLTSVLREAKILTSQQVVSFQPRVVGEGAGFLGEVIILDLEYDSPTTAPTSMVLKMPTRSSNRRLGQALGVYEREIRFYSDLQPQVSIPTPIHYYSAVSAADDPAKGLQQINFLNKLPYWLLAILTLLATWLSGLVKRRYVLLIENIGHLRVGDQVNGCSEADTKRALNTMAKLHGQFWNSPIIENEGWIVPLALTGRFTHMMYLQSIEKFKTHNKHWLEPAQLVIFDWLKDNAVDVMNAVCDSPFTLIHGDFRLDNIGFDEGTDEVLLFDWQTILQGAPGFELAYFLSHASEAADARGFVDYYADQLRTQDIPVSRDWIHWQYNASLLLMLHRVAPATFQEMLQFGEERGATLMENWVKSIFEQLRDVNYIELLASKPESN